MGSQPHAEHYFAATPAAPERPRTIAVELAGRRCELLVSSGVFSPGRIDPGTAVLLRTVGLPGADGADLGGARNLLDLGCGWGPIALSLAMSAPEASVWAVDVNQRALELTRTNAERLGLRNVVAALPDDVPGDIRFAEIWSNPPIRVGKSELHRLLQTWLSRLKPDGVAWLVVQKNLGADSLANWLRDQEFSAGTSRSVDKVASAKGYRVLRVR